MKHELLLGKVSNTAAGTLDFDGEWRNQLGSRMLLTVSGASLRGEYYSAVSGGGSPIRGDLTGFVNGDLISFVVNWPSAAVTAWVGQVINDNGNELIETLWQMTTNVPDNQEPTGMWQSVFAGTDRFHR
ncbi:avidin/streptavidin family protein [Rhizobium laguerreae]|uniref:avidin/streptavidin family protein n=1 Tax=Rhizobium laguerreae TaxID=1076926 RepID=UPI001C8FF03A|nr:avidin/streptavidin family protein [Rhizobium laguerreae]MBY3565705.1 avidin [Rhizobium laguerreae]